MGLIPNREQGFCFNKDCENVIDDGSEANITAIVLGILCSILAVMAVFLGIAYVIRVKQ